MDEYAMIIRCYETIPVEQTVQLALELELFFGSLLRCIFLALP